MSLPVALNASVEASTSTAKSALHLNNIGLSFAHDTTTGQIGPSAEPGHESNEVSSTLASFRLPTCSESSSPLTGAEPAPSIIDRTIEMDAKLRRKADNILSEAFEGILINFAVERETLLTEIETLQKAQNNDAATIAIITTEKADIQARFEAEEKRAQQSSNHVGTLRDDVVELREVLEKEQDRSSEHLHIISTLRTRVNQLELDIANSTDLRKHESQDYEKQLQIIQDRCHDFKSRADHFEASSIRLERELMELRAEASVTGNQNRELLDKNDSHVKRNGLLVENNKQLIKSRNEAISNLMVILAVLRQARKDCARLIFARFKEANVDYNVESLRAFLLPWLDLSVVNDLLSREAGFTPYVRTSAYEKIVPSGPAPGEKRKACSA